MEDFIGNFTEEEMRNAVALIEQAKKNEAARKQERAEASKPRPFTEEEKRQANALVAYAKECMAARRLEHKKKK
uniref:Uncharacterized protein n=1 Tax=viral metagenome TaxID=1070528 RepID=A0A6C0KNP8_9ZZZZ